MKNKLFLLVMLFVLAFTINAQNDTMYVMKNGLVEGKYNVNTEIDSVIFYNPTNVTSDTVTDIDGNVSLTTGNSLSLENAINSINGVGTINITGKIIIDAAITVPRGIVLKIQESGSLFIQNADFLSIEGSVLAGLYPIFNNILTFKEGSVDEVKAEWWEGDGDFKVNIALLSANNIPVRITDDITVNAAILMNSNQTLKMYDAIIFPTAPMTGGAVIKNRNLNSTNVTVLGGTIDGTDESTVGYDAVLFKTVDNSLIKDVNCINVHIRSSHDTGNLHLVNTTNTKIENCTSIGTHKMGIKIDYGSHNSIIGGYFNRTGDSGIGAIDSPYLLIDGVYVDNCGIAIPVGASNIAANLQYATMRNSISINGKGTDNGNGITIGHEGYPALDCVFENNLVANNNAKGVFVQGTTCENVIIQNNIILENGLGTNHLSSAGIAVYYGVANTLIENNEIIGNKRGVELRETSLDTRIINNRMTNNIVEDVLNGGTNTIVENNNEKTDLSYLFDLPLTDLQLSVLENIINN